MKVTVCQIDPREEHLDTYLQELTSHIKNEKSNFILLPEMSFSEWLASDSNASAQRWEESVDNHSRYISDLGKLNAPAVMGSRPIITDSGSRRNEAYVWTSESNTAVGIHQKYYLPNEDGYWEHTWYDRGDKSFDTARVGEAIVGVQICTEMWFFEWARHYAKSKIDMLCIPRGTPNGTLDKWLAGGRVSAVCSGAYSLSSNLWCPSGGGYDLGGMGWIIDPEGNVLAQTDEDDPFATTDIDLEFPKLSKSTYPRYVPE